MSIQYHEQIHTDALRLRLLLTNRCDQNCPHCLNEYMCKPTNAWPVQFIDERVFERIVIAYDRVLRQTPSYDGSIYSMRRKIYFSGGEPTLHPCFENFVRFIHNDITDTEVTLCTNGHAWEQLMLGNIYDKIDHLHFSFGFLQSTLVLNHFIPIWENLREWRKEHDKKNIVFSVVTNNDPDFERVLIDMLQYQKDTNFGFTVKLWGDLRFSQDHAINRRYSSLLMAYPELIHRGPVQRPVNRGVGCEGCTKSCPTLKALWVRPDDTCSPCPQAVNWNPMRSGERVDTETEMEYWIQKALKYHFTYGEPDAMEDRG